MKIVHKIALLAGLVAFLPWPDIEAKRPIFKLDLSRTSSDTLKELKESILWSQQETGSVKLYAQLLENINWNLDQRRLRPELRPVVDVQEGSVEEAMGVGKIDRPIYFNVGSGQIDAPVGSPTVMQHHEGYRYLSPEIDQSRTMQQQQAIRYIPIQPQRYYTPQARQQQPVIVPQSGSAPFSGGGYYQPFIPVQMGSQPQYTNQPLYGGWVPMWR